MNQEITDLLKAYEKALNTSDAAAALTLYGSEPIFMAQNAPAFVGRDAVQASYEFIFKTLKLNVVFTVHEIVPMGEDLAYGRTTSAGEQEILATHQNVPGGEQRTVHLPQRGRSMENPSLSLCHQQPACCGMTARRSFLPANLGGRA